MVNAALLASQPIENFQPRNGVAVGLLLLRLVAGLGLSVHGYNKFFKGGKLAGTARWFNSIGMKPGKIHALAAASTEVGGGLLLAAGLFTPLAGASFVGLMFVAFWTVHKGHGFLVISNGWEYNLVLATIGTVVGIAGPGRYSLDRAIGFHVTELAGFGLSAGLGLVVAALTLAVFFRPPEKA
jgi:putative oxidoreductase